MKTKLLIKSLLVAAGLSMGMNAWAAVGDVTTNANIDFSNAIVSSGSSPKYSIAGTVGSMNWERQWTFAPAIENGILRFGNFDDYVDAETPSFGGGVVELQNNTIGAKDVVAIKFDMAFGKLSGKHVGFKFVDTAGNTILTQWFDAYNGDFDDYNPLGLDWSEMYRGSNEVIQERCVNFTITIDYSANTIKTETTCLLSGASKPATNGSHTVALPSSTPIGKFVLMGNINNAGRFSTFDNLLIQTTEGDYTIATAGYTVNWECDNVVIKSDDTRSGDVGAAITLLPADLANFEYGEQRYIYVSDDASSNTIADDGSSVVTVTVRKAEKYNYTITTSYNSNVLAWSKSGSVWEDQNTVGFQVPRFQAYNETTLVEAPFGNSGALDKSVTVTENGFTSDVEYKATDISNLYLLSEAENLGTGIATNATTYTNRVSNGAIIFASTGTLMSLAPGKYIFTLGVIGGDTNSHQVTYTVSAGTNEIVNGTCTGNVLKLLSSNEFTLLEATDITFTCSDPASGRGIDLVYVQKTGDATVSPAVTDYATFSSTYALDFASATGVKAYYASSSSDGTNVTMTKVTGAVAAGTGLLLQKTEGDIAIPVAATGTDLSASNLLKAGTGAEVKTEGDTHRYVLAGEGESTSFYNLASPVAIPVGKAYLEVVTSAARLNITFSDSEATGISSVKASQSTEQVYDLQGRRVAQPTKGLYIVNGKKVIKK